MKKTMSSKSRLVLVVLAALFGLLGVHRMYVGKVWTGVIILILTVTGVLIWAAVIWVIIDLIMAIMGIFQDKGGREVHKWLD